MLNYEQMEPIKFVIIMDLPEAFSCNSAMEGSVVTKVGNEQRSVEWP